MTYFARTDSKTIQTEVTAAMLAAAAKKCEVESKKLEAKLRK